MGGGPVLMQKAVRVEEDDTEAALAARIAPQADIAYVEAIRRMASGLYELEGRRFVLRSRAERDAASTAVLEGESGTEESQEQESAIRR